MIFSFVKGFVWIEYPPDFGYTREKTDGYGNNLWIWMLRVLYIESTIADTTGCTSRGIRVFYMNESDLVTVILDKLRTRNRFEDLYACIGLVLPITEKISPDLRSPV